MEKKLRKIDQLKQYSWVWINKFPVKIEIGALEVFAFKTLKYGVLNNTQTVNMIFLNFLWTSQKIIVYLIGISNLYTRAWAEVSSSQNR